MNKQDRGHYLWLPEPRKAKAGTPPAPVPLRSNDSKAKEGARNASFGR